MLEAVRAEAKRRPMPTGLIKLAPLCPKGWTTGVSAMADSAAYPKGFTDFVASCLDSSFKGLTWQSPIVPGGGGNPPAAHQPRGNPLRRFLQLAAPAGSRIEPDLDDDSDGASTPGAACCKRRKLQ